MQLLPNYERRSSLHIVLSKTLAHSESGTKIINDTDHGCLFVHLRATAAGVAVFCSCHEGTAKAHALVGKVRRTPEKLHLRLQVSIQSEKVRDREET